MQETNADWAAIPGKFHRPIASNYPSIMTHTTPSEIGFEPRDNQPVYVPIDEAIRHAALCQDTRRVVQADVQYEWRRSKFILVNDRACLIIKQVPLDAVTSARVTMYH